MVEVIEISYNQIDSKLQQYFDKSEKEAIEDSLVDTSTLIFFSYVSTLLIYFLIIFVLRMFVLPILIKTLAIIRIESSFLYDMIDEDALSTEQIIIKSISILLILLFICTTNFSCFFSSYYILYDISNEYWHLSHKHKTNVFPKKNEEQKRLIRKFLSNFNGKTTKEIELLEPCWFSILIATICFINCFAFFAIQFLKKIHFESYEPISQVENNNSELLSYKIRYCIRKHLKNFEKTLKKISTEIKNNIPEVVLSVFISVLLSFFTFLITNTILIFFLKSISNVFAKSKDAFSIHKDDNQSSSPQTQENSLLAL